jgi:hypothetical protein
MRFILVKDLILNKDFEDLLVLSKGDIISPDIEGKYFFDKLNKTFLKETILSKPDIFKPIEEIEFIVEEIINNNEDKIGNWRIQLDVKTSRKKLKEIERIFKEIINDIL